eukprot:TRINITY_DN347_c0_g2_i1.p1 TRINITY_DN347_c0_g2~~TRINITY_DN347_c0_g2_i1.p1  ORF type:complete len:274 (+),score=69.58 TRINITY_DN347_c0_g2_i1:100-822(+)
MESRRQAARQPPRVRVATLALVGVVAAAAVTTFVGGNWMNSNQRMAREDSPVTMYLKSGRWSNGRPNTNEIQRRRVQNPQLNNMRDMYYILFARSKKVKQWKPINIISGSEAAKTFKNIGENQVVKALGGDKFAKGQIVKAIGMNLYQKKEEVNEQATKMHATLKYATELEYGYKEILNNTKFNDKPFSFLDNVNVSVVPPEAELRSLLDDAGDAVGNAGSSISKVGDNIKGFFSSGQGR